MFYRKKPVVIQAVQWRGDNQHELFHFLGHVEDMNYFDPKGNHNFYINADKELIIKTLEGDMKGSINDFIIRGVDGEFYPCKPEIFLKTYEPVV